MPIKVVEKTAKKLTEVSPFKKKMMENYMNKMKGKPSLKPKPSLGEPLRKPRDPKGTGPMRPTFRKKFDALKKRKPMSS